ncbi:hypothetical protein FQR65_LT20997 [Abscondita terminalis]|nr:hypothetical protein FQR65_LT20997 [Abscondita terminalis]
MVPEGLRTDRSTSSATTTIKDFKSVTRSWKSWHYEGPSSDEDPAAFTTRLAELQSIAQRVADGRDLKEAPRLDRKRFRSAPRKCGSSTTEQLQEDGQGPAACRPSTTTGEALQAVAGVEAITAVRWRPGFGRRSDGHQRRGPFGPSTSSKVDDQAALNPTRANASDLPGADRVTPMTAKEWPGQAEGGEAYLLPTARGAPRGDKTKDRSMASRRKAEGMSAPKRLGRSPTREVGTRRAKSRNSLGCEMRPSGQEFSSAP